MGRNPKGAAFGAGAREQNPSRRATAAGPSTIRRSRRRGRVSRTLLGAGLALTTVLAGCATESGDGGAVTPVACDAPGVTEDSIRVGFIYPDSGVAAEAFRAARSGVAARIGMANGAGGVHGRKIDLVWRDDAANASMNLQAARDLVNNENVLGIVEATIGASGSAEWLDQQGIPVTGLTAEDVWKHHDNMFGRTYQFGRDNTITTFGEFAKAQGGTRAVVVEESTPEVAQQLVASLEAQGIPIVGRVNYLEETSSPIRAANEIAATEADVLISGVSVNGLTEVLGALRQIGYEMKVMLSPTGYNREYLSQYGQDMAGLTVALNFTPFESESTAVRVYREAIGRYSPELGVPDQELAIASYIITDLFLYGLQVAGPCPTREAFIRNLREVTDYDAGGLVPGPVNLRENREKPNTCYAFVRVNAEGTAYEVVPDPAGNTQWCGENIQVAATADGAAGSSARAAGS